jgi:cellulose synthase/poly-beta-1,6-N-acetylglucosamine synthase-like glycosyltransferase
MIVLNPVCLVETVAYSLLSAVFLFYLVYFLILRKFGGQAKRVENLGSADPPKVSLIVPTYNEGKTIRKKLKNIDSLIYPKERLETIFVDGCSTDDTPQIIQSYIDEGRHAVRLVRQSERKGYNEGIFEGLKNASNEIIVLTDAGAYYDSHALRYLVRHFGDPKVGAVTGREVVMNVGKRAARLESTYRFFYDFMRLAETNMDSTPDLKGEISAVKKDICLHAVERAKRSPNASFDCCVPYQVRMEGQRVLYDSDSFYHEYAPETFKDRMKQQVRRGSILITPLLLYKEMIFNKKYGKFGRVILPAHFIMLVLVPWFFLIGLAVLLVGTVMDPVRNLIMLGILMVPVVASGRARVFVLSFTQSQIALVLSCFRIGFRKKSMFITTISSTRQ